MYVPMVLLGLTFEAFRVTNFIEMSVNYVGRDESDSYMLFSYEQQITLCFEPINRLKNANIAVMEFQKFVL